MKKQRRQSLNAFFDAYADAQAQQQAQRDALPRYQGEPFSYGWGVTDLQAGDVVLLIHQDQELWPAQGSGVDPAKGLDLRVATLAQAPICLGPVYRLPLCGGAECYMMRHHWIAKIVHQTKVVNESGDYRRR